MSGFKTFVLKVRGNDFDAVNDKIEVWERDGFEVVSVAHFPNGNPFTLVVLRKLLK